MEQKPPVVKTPEEITKERVELMKNISAEDIRTGYQKKIPISLRRVEFVNLQEINQVMSYSISGEGEIASFPTTGDALQQFLSDFEGDEILKVNLPIDLYDIGQELKGGMKVADLIFTGRYPRLHHPMSIDAASSNLEQDKEGHVKIGEGLYMTNESAEKLRGLTWENMLEKMTFNANLPNVVLEDFDRTPLYKEGALESLIEQTRASGTSFVLSSSDGYKPIHNLFSDDIVKHLTLPPAASTVNEIQAVGRSGRDIPLEQVVIGAGSPSHLSTIQGMGRESDMFAIKKPYVIEDGVKIDLVEGDYSFGTTRSISFMPEVTEDQYIMSQPVAEAAYAQLLLNPPAQETPFTTALRGLFEKETPVPIDSGKEALAKALANLNPSWERVIDGTLYELRNLTVGEVARRRCDEGWEIANPESSWPLYARRIKKLNKPE